MFSPGPLYLLAKLQEAMQVISADIRRGYESCVEGDTAALGLPEIDWSFTVSSHLLLRLAPHPPADGFNQTEPCILESHYALCPEPAPLPVD